MRGAHLTPTNFLCDRPPQLLDNQRSLRSILMTANSSKSSNQSSATSGGRHFPAWLESSPGAIYGGWEPLMYLRRDRSDGAWEKLFVSQHSDKAIRKMAGSGVNIFITHYHKGHGWDIIQKEVQDINRQVRTMRKVGIVPGVYFRVDNVFGETFFLEHPEARNWLVVNSEGKGACMLNRPFRHRVCRNVPAYRQYVRKVLRYAITEIGVDLFALDGFHGASEVEECRCGHCQQRFREFLKRRWQHRPKEAEEYFGFSRLEGVEIPPLAPGNRNAGSAVVITDPVYQEYIRFRCDDWAEWHRFIMRTVRDANPKVVVSINCGVLSWQNTAAQQGLYLPLLDTRNTMIFIEDGHFPAVREGGVISHRIRDYQIPSVLGARCIAYCHEYSIPYLKRAICESLAFNHGIVGHISHGWDIQKVFDTPAAEVRRRIIKWVAAHRSFWQGSAPAAEVGVLRDFASLAFDCYHPLQQTMLAEETLIRKQIPFVPVFDEQLDDLLGKRLKVLVCAGQTCLPDPVIEKLVRFVAGGGRLLVTGNTGGRTDWAMTRKENALVKALHLGGHRSAWDPATSAVKHDAKFERTFADNSKAGASLTWPPFPSHYDRVLGKGKVATIPQIVPSVKEEVWYPAWQFNPEAGAYDIPGNAANPEQRRHKEYPFVNWRLPVNAGQIVDAIRWLYDDVPFQVDAPDSTVVNWLGKAAAAGQELIHFLNYANDGAVQGAAVFFLGAKYRRAVFHVLDPEPRTVDLTARLATNRLPLPPFLTYGVLVLDRRGD